MLRILFVIPYKEMEENVKQIFEEVLPLEKDEITYETCRAEGGTLETDVEDVDVVISRGFTAAQYETNLPKIELQVSAFDMMKAVHECIQKFESKKIAFIGTTNMILGADSINEIMESVEIIGRHVPVSEELGRNLDDLIDQGVDTIIGGRAVAEYAEKRSIHYVLLKSGKESIYQAVEEAIVAMKFSQEEKGKREYLQAIMDYSFEGIISTDVKGRILSVNRFAVEKLREGNRYGLKAEDMIGKEIEDFFPEIKIDMLSGKLLAKLITSGKQKYMVNCVQLTGKETTEGWIVTFRDIANIQKDEEKIRKQLHNKGLCAKYHFENIIWKNKCMKDTIQIAMKYAGAESNVFIHGETGTGKELFAQSIHNASARRSGPFVAVNCAALPESLLESELFGYVEGAFTGASKGGKAGLFELAHNGTLFLDEIGDMAINLQARLLRVIQEKEIMRLGGNQVIPVNVRIIAAANKDMRLAVEEGTFRQDLLYRIDVLRLELPPLRSRGKDILELAAYYIGREQLKSQCALKGLNEEAQNWLLRQPWKGNIRELRNFCERLCVLCEKDQADMTDILFASGYASEADEADSKANENHIDEKSYIEAVLRKYNYSRKDTAAALNIDASTLWRKIKKYGINCRK